VSRTISLTLAALMLLPAAGPGPAEPTAGPSGTSGLLCTADEVRNESTGQVLPPVAPVFHAPGHLRQDGDFYLRTETQADEHGSIEAEHRIHRRTGAFETISMQTVHEVGEQYLVRITGTCKPADHRPLAQPSRY